MAIVALGTIVGVFEANCHLNSVVDFLTAELFLSRVVLGFVFGCFSLLFCVLLWTSPRG